MKILKIAWNNLWRNKVRTLITVAAVVIAVLLSTIMTSMQDGTYSKMIDNVVRFYSGYIQIHQAEYWDNKTINNIYIPDDSLENAITHTPGITNSTRRLESFILISTGENTKGTALIGIDLKKEDEITGISKWVIKGKYLSPGEEGVIISENLAKHLDIKIGDTIIFMGMGYHGATAAGLMAVKGIFKYPSPQLSTVVYMDITHSQNLYSAPGMISSYILMTSDNEQAELIAQQLSQTLPKELYGVKTWDKMFPEIKQMIESDKAGGVITKLILYAIVGFGILGTIIMMMAERKRELGILLAIGMRKNKIIAMLSMEAILIGLLGVIAGFVISLPIILAFINYPIHIAGEMAKAYEQFGIEPILYFGISFDVFFTEIITVLIMTLVIALYPIYVISRMNVIKALRS